MSVRRRRQFAISESLASSVGSSLAFSGSAGQLLDGVEEANLLAAWSRSLLLLSSYDGGNLTRIREAGGNTELDIGHDSAGAVDSAAIASHCGASDGFEVTRYDQSGNAKNISAAGGDAEEPKAYDGGTTTEENINGAPASTGDTTDDEVALFSGVGLAGNPAFTLAFNGSLAVAGKVFLGFGTNSAAQRLWLQSQITTTDINFGFNGANRILRGADYTTARSYIVRMAAGTTVGAVRCLQDGTEMTEVSSLNPSTNPNFADTELNVFGTGGSSAGLKNGMVAVWNADITDSADEAKILAALDAHNGV